MFKPSLFIIPKTRGNQKVHQLVNGFFLTVIYLYHNKKEQHDKTNNGMDEFQKHESK